jgi:hypothetical protein
LCSTGIKRKILVIPIKVTVQYSHKFVITPDNTAGARELSGFIEAPDLIPTIYNDDLKYTIMANRVEIIYHHMIVLLPFWEIIRTTN